jgi:5-methylcytosine-specific restriction endonuclease McrA
MRRASPLRQRSRETERIYREVRVPLVKELLETHPVCQRCGQNRSNQVHEVLTRARGGSITDRENCRAVCSDCHIWIHLHPVQSEREGWLISRNRRDG